MTALLAFTAAQAATNYGINVGGQEVNSDNYNNVTGGSIMFYSGGYVSYNTSTKVLTLHNVKISRSTDNDYAVHNRSVQGLSIVFSGTCDLETRDHTLHFDKSTTVQVTAAAR